LEPAEIFASNGLTHDEMIRIFAEVLGEKKKTWTLGAGVIAESA